MLQKHCGFCAVCRMFLYLLITSVCASIFEKSVIQIIKPVIIKHMIFAYKDSYSFTHCINIINRTCHYSTKSTENTVSLFNKFHET